MKQGGQLTDSPTVTNEFKEWVVEWVEWDEIESKAKEDLKHVKKRKKELSTNMLKFMRGQNIGEIAVSDGSVRKKVTNRSKPLSKPVMKTLMVRSNMLIDNTEQGAQNLIDFLYGNREISTIESLVRNVSK